MSKYKPITITPKEKAEQLIGSVMFSKNQSIDYSDGIMKPLPTNIYYKACALAIVNEIFQFMREDDDEVEDEDEDTMMKARGNNSKDDKDSNNSNNKDVGQGLGQ